MDDIRLSQDERERIELELLVTRCQLGEPEAFADLVERWHEPLWRYVRAVTADREVAQEVIQEGWVRILRGIDRLRDPSRLKAWLFSVVRRAFIDRLRIRYSEADLETLDEEPLDDASPDELAWEDLARLQVALDRLSPSDRETTVLFYLRELDLQEVAALLGVPVGTVKSRLHRSRRILHDWFAPKGAPR